ncbi:MAG: hypothetical protein HPY53_10575 [Brevinematales bacterium]|nr:hypothetical protein [Brevinematales bacterium]
MSCESVDKLQNLLADNVFCYATDKKKAAGRALGTFIEIITYYLLKSWRLESFIAIERPLPEYANETITHNVEFTLHGNSFLCSGEYTQNDFPISSNRLRSKHNEISSEAPKKSIMLVSKDGIIRNACTIYENPDSFVNVYINSTDSTYGIYELFDRPFAMFECKRVGVEEGTRKGPQTIEKAKQGSYVAKTVSSLQKIRNNDGSLGGLINLPDGTYNIKEYYTLLDEVIKSNEKQLLNNFILTVGVVSNHGNWFTSDTPNKELRVLAQSYDWLIFLTDKGISEFITDLLIKPAEEYKDVKIAFNKSYNAEKKQNVFTKVNMDYSADIALDHYFSENSKRIETWFNVIAPREKSLDFLKEEIFTLTKKDWAGVYK